tara:strand:+ start:159 stop:335 length:177 start_codon:yes stop_codon:yes gene_type:complete
MIDKKTLLITVAIIIAGILYAYFNPYASCKRDIKKAYELDGPDMEQTLSMIASKECNK